MLNHRHKRISIPVLFVKEMNFILLDASSGGQNPWEFPKGIRFSPNSEIQTGKMTQDLGAETNRKNRGIPKVVCRDFFNSFMPKRLRQIAGFNFGFRV